MVAPHRRVVLAGRDLESLRGEVRHDPPEELELSSAVDLHASSMARSPRAAASGSGASPTALTTQARRTPAAVSWARFEASMPPIAKTGTVGPTARRTAATPLGPITAFWGLSGVAKAGPEPM